MRSQSPTWRLETPSKSATSWRLRPSAIHSRAESRWKMRRSPICRRRCSISWRCLALNTMVFIAHRPAAGVGHIRVLDRSSTKIIVGKTGTTRLYPGDRYELVTFFDCLHDMGDPVGAARHVRETLSEDGTWLIVEPLAGDRLEENRCSSRISGRLPDVQVSSAAVQLS